MTTSEPSLALEMAEAAAKLGVHALMPPSPAVMSGPAKRGSRS